MINDRTLSISYNPGQTADFPLYDEYIDGTKRPTDKIIFIAITSYVRVIMDPASERKHALFLLGKAVVPLIESIDARIIPAEGMMFVHAIRGARDADDVAGFQGGIVSRDGIVIPPGPAVFGSGEAGSRVILTAMKFDPSIRSAAIIRFTPLILTALESAFLECCSFNRIREPEGTNTMDWGVASCCREGVPDVIYDRGTPAKKGLVRLLGEEPDDVANNIIILSKRILDMDI